MITTTTTTSYKTNDAPYIYPFITIIHPTFLTLVSNFREISFKIGKQNGKWVGYRDFSCTRYTWKYLNIIHVNIFTYCTTITSYKTNDALYIYPFIIIIHPTFLTLVSKNREISFKYITIFTFQIIPFHTKWEMSGIPGFQLYMTIRKSIWIYTHTHVTSLVLL